SSDGDAQRRRAAETAARRKLGVGLDAHGGRGERPGLARRGEKIAKRSRYGARRDPLLHLEVPALHQQNAALAFERSGLGRRPSIDAHGDRRNAVDDRVLPEQDRLAAGRAPPRHAERSPSAPMAPKSAWSA